MRPDTTYALWMDHSRTGYLRNHLYEKRLQICRVMHAKAIAVEVLPKHLDEQVASYMVKGFGGVMTKLTSKQADYIGVGVEGPFKTDSYKY